MTDDEEKNSIDLFTKAVTCTPRPGAPPVSTLPESGSRFR
jgi:hypothetical protein